MALIEKPASDIDGQEKPQKIKSIVSFLITFFVMMISWIILSGKFVPLLIGLGIFSSFIVAYFFYDLLMPAMEPTYIKIFVRFIQYIPWLLKEIVKANFHMMYITFHPKIREIIDPHTFTFETNLKSDIAIATMANSITLTPGTITITADTEGVFCVHAIDKESADALPGEMLKRVAHIFGEEI